MREELLPKQKRFCEYYASDREFFGNGVESYVEAYEVDQTKPNWYNSACSSASRLLSNAKIIAKINEILVETGFNETQIDKQLSFLIAQHADFASKLGAIKEYNKLKNRITERSEVLVKELPILGNLRKHSSNAKNIGVAKKD